VEQVFHCISRSLTIFSVEMSILDLGKTASSSKALTRSNVSIAKRTSAVCSLFNHANFAKPCHELKSRVVHFSLSFCEQASLSGRKFEKLQ